MARSYTTAALDNSLRLNQIADLINGRFTEVTDYLDAMIPNTSHSIPATPTAGQVLYAVDANTLGWLTINNTIKAATDATAYFEDDVILFNSNLYLVLNNYTSGTPFAVTGDLKQVSGQTEAESIASIVDHYRFTTDYADSAPDRTYTVEDGKRYFIDALAGGITNEVFEVPDLSGATTEFSFTIMPRERDFSANPLTITRNGSDGTAQFFTMADPTAIIADDITINTNGVYEFVGRRESSQTKWTVIKLDYN